MGCGCIHCGAEYAMKRVWGKLNQGLGRLDWNVANGWGSRQRKGRVPWDRTMSISTCSEAYATSCTQKQSQAIVMCVMSLCKRSDLLAQFLKGLWKQAQPDAELDKQHQEAGSRSNGAQYEGALPWG